MKYAVGFVFGIVAALSLSALAEDAFQRPIPEGFQSFMLAGGKDETGSGRALKMTVDGRVLAKCTEDHP